MMQFFDGNKLFDRWGVSLSTEIVFSDYCMEMLFPLKDTIRHTDKALLFLSSQIEDDWLELDSIEFIPWNCIEQIRNIHDGEKVAQCSHAELNKWLGSLSFPAPSAQFHYARPGLFAYIAQGKPRSMRSGKGKDRLKRDVGIIKDAIRDDFGHPHEGPVEIKIDVFSSEINKMADIDRLTVPVLDAFQDVVYIDDKQVRLLQPRLFSSYEAYVKLEKKTNPMGCCEFANMPLGSLYPLATGVMDYYVVRINTYE